MPSAVFEGAAADDRPQASSLLTMDGQVDPTWIDYNGHMTEWQYYRILADAGENFLRAFGFTEEYRLGGFSFFSVEGHLRNLRECRVDTPFRVYSDMIGYDAIRLHIYQYMVDAKTGTCLATGEHMMLHVDTAQRRASPMGPYMHGCAEAAMANWVPRLRPKGLGGQIKPA